MNHSISFKDPETGAHTNAIESSWRAAKAVGTCAGRKKEHVAGNLAKYMFNKRCAERKVDRFEEFLQLAARLYDPTRGSGRDGVPSHDDAERDSDDQELHA